MSDTDGSGRAGGRRRERGIFERPPGSGAWWVCYFDEHGRRHREKVGPKALAIKVYQKRKNEIHERRFFPERIRRRDVPIGEMIDDYLTRNRERLRWFDHYERYGRMWTAASFDTFMRTDGTAIAPAGNRRHQGHGRSGTDCAA
jgi:hypothetical protein